MSISGGLSAALSGLTAANKAVEVISNNIANATTAGYGRRVLLTESRAVGGSGQGVRIIGIRRESDLALQNDRRQAQAATAASTTRAAFLSKLEQAVGTTDSSVSLQSRIADLDSALIEASSRPDSEARLQAVLDGATALAQQIGQAASKVQSARGDADAAIATTVGSVNTALRQIADLNGQIRATGNSGGDASALMDQRQVLIDGIAEAMPLRVTERDGGEVAIYTTNGAALLDGLPATLGFTRSNVVTADMSLAAGTLSGLTLNGRPIQTAGTSSPIAGGALAAQFAIRDDLGPEAQTQLDALARDLVGRFSASGLDPTQASGAAGLFTDAGQPFDAANETGLAQRLAVNAAVDPDQGGALWRLREGLGATAASDTGQTDFLLALQSALTTARQPASGGFATGAVSYASLASTFISGIATDRVSADSEESFATARSAALEEQEAAAGVDTDQELQSLLVMEQAYAANAKVIQTIGDMLDKLLEM